MSTGPTDPGRSPYRTAAALLVLPLLATALSACSDDDPTADIDREAQAARGIAETLAKRSSALMSRDVVRFDRTVAQRDERFADEQGTYYENLSQLPVDSIRYRVDADTVEAQGDHFWAEVDVRLALRGYDAAPVITRDRYRFTPSRNHHRYLLTSTTDERWEAEFRPQEQPWDLGPIDVEESAGVLGIFDEVTMIHADEVVASVAAGRSDVADVVPDPSDRGVVVYAMGDTTFLRTVGGLPVSEPDRLDAATIPVARDATESGGPVASYRILLNPRVLDQAGPVLDRLVRHELTHVALGERGRAAPVWLSEGIAEYVSVRPVAPSERRIPEDALDLVAGGVDGLPPDQAFAGPDAESWYAVAWWICEFIASTYGEPVLWSLLETLRRGDDQDAEIERTLGITSAELAAEGAGMMVRTYG